MVVAYAHNDYIKYATDTPFNNSDPYTASSVGQKKPYLAGRKNIKTYKNVETCWLAFPLIFKNKLAKKRNEIQIFHIRFLLYKNLSKMNKLLECI